MKPIYYSYTLGIVFRSRSLKQFILKFIKLLLFVEGIRVEGKVTLEWILSFATGAMWEPVAGFAMNPTVQFKQYTQDTGLYPTANTCANVLYLPYILDGELPKDDILYERFDMAFMNAYFGMI